MRPGSIVVLCILLAAPLVVADPGGVDAPNDVSGAVTVPSGVVYGEIGPSDPADWYRVEIAPNTGIQATLNMAGQPHGFLRLTADDGTYIDRLPFLPVSGNATLAFVQGGRGSAVRVGIEATTTGGTLHNYSLQLTPIGLPNVSVSNLKGADAPRPVSGVIDHMWKSVDFDVSNTGLEAGTGDLLVTALTPTDQHQTTLVWRRISIGAGDKQHIAFTWDTSGAVGTIDLTINALISWDYDPFDNVASASTFSLIDGHGQGIAAFGWRGACPSLGSDAECAQVDATDGSVMISSTGSGLQDASVQAMVTPGAPQVTLCETSVGCAATP